MPLRMNKSYHDDNKFGRFLLISLLIHGLLWIALAANWFGTARRVKPPVYYVDLVHKPVLKPQAGRPDSRPVKQSKPAPPKPKPIPEVTPVKTVTPVEPKPQPTVTPPAQQQPKPAPEVRPNQKLQSALDEIRERQARQAERDALKAKLAALQQSATIPDDVPVGMPDGSGTEVGVSALAFVQAYIQQNWALSPYLLANPSRMGSIEAKVLLVYAADGRLERFRILEASGDSQFDDSIKKAITKSQQLPQPLPQRVELSVLFNLKEMAQARR